jgi:NADH-quinone oxidoreductase subunit N
MDGRLEMTFAMNDLVAASAEIFVLAMACVILIVDLFVKNPRRTTTFVLTILTLLGAAYLTFRTNIGDTGFAFSNMYVDDLFGDLLKLILYLAVIVTLFYARDYLLERAPMARGEYYVLTLFATLGMMVMISANSFLTIYIGLELLSLSLYAMVAMNRDSVRSIEAAMKYFVLGALASGFLLYGMSMIYGATGSLELNRILEALVMKSANQTILTFGIVFVVAGLAFKLGVVPFHMWVPDVYDGAPTPVTMFIAGAAKIAAFAILFRILVNALITQAAPSPTLGGGAEGVANWQDMLVVMSVLSMAIGNLAAIAQTNIKRMLAFSAISHMGFVLLGMSVGIVNGDPRYAYFAYPASMFYIVTYVLMSIGAFGMILLMARSGFESDQLDDFRGLNKRSPWFAGMMLVLMLSMAGIPFFVGFFAKFSVLQAVVLAERYWLAVAAVMFSLIGAFYYLRVVKIMYFDEPKEDTPIPAPIDMRVLMSMNGLAVIALGIFPDTLMKICAYALLNSV